MSQCRQYALMGPRCTLEEGHEGKHFDGGTFRWSDKSQRDLLNRYGGTRGT